MENKNNNLNLNLIASRIKQMRLANNWTQKDLANKLGLKNDTAIANYESGYSIPKDDIKLKICEIFGCTMDYLMGTSEFKTLDEEIQNLKDSFVSLGIKPEEVDTMLYQDTDLSPTEQNILSDLLEYSSNSFENGNIKNIDINTFLGNYALTNKQKDDIIRNYIITLESQSKVFSKLSVFSSKYFSEKQEQLLDSIKENILYSKSNLYLCSVYGQIAAGQPNWAEECLEGYLPIDPNLMNIQNPDECFFLRINRSINEQSCKRWCLCTN